MTDDNNNISRRTVIKGTGAAAITAGIAGCGGGGNGNGNGGNGNGNGNGGNGNGSGSGELEIVHWWTAGGEQEAINALIEGFEEANSDISVTNNPAPGGAGSALDTEIQNRVLNENAPSTFQIWPGGSLQTYTQSDRLADISDSVWDSEMEDAYLDGVKELSQDADGNYVAVPLNIHRLNNLFYNVEVVEEAGVQPGDLDSPSDLLSAMETIANETDAAPMAHQTQAVWSTLQLWEDVLIGGSGVSTYTDMLENGASNNEDGVRQALQTVADMREYFNEDAGSIAWDQANSKVINGEAAFIHQGDWAAGQYGATDGFEFEDDWDYVPFPGTDGVYHVVTDSFVKPTPNPSPDATDAFLSYAGSVEGQELFNPIKGSIPPRTDVPDDEFGPFLTTQRNDFEDSGSQPPTIAHGTGVSPGVKSNVEGAFSTFIGNWNVDTAYNQLSNAF